MGNSVKGEKTKADVLRVARRMFYEYGYKETTVRSVFQEANTNCDFRLPSE